jgi:hypothetical protein
MERWFTAAKLATLVLFLAMSLGAVGYEMIYVWPVQRCADRGAWWDYRDRQCLTPIPIWRITGRALAGYKVGGAAPASAANPPGTAR